jgi:hypothetical protein
LVKKMGDSNDLGGNVEAKSYTIEFSTYGRSLSKMTRGMMSKNKKEIKMGDFIKSVDYWWN